MTKKKYEKQLQKYKRKNKQLLDHIDALKDENTILYSINAAFEKDLRMKIDEVKESIVIVRYLEEKIRLLNQKSEF